MKTEMKNHQKRKTTQNTTKKIFRIFYNLLPALPIILFIVLNCIFVFQKNIIYICSYFTLQSKNLALLESVKLKDENFDVYIVDKNKDLDIIYFHPNAVNKNVDFLISNIVQKTNFNIIIPFYRGYCTSKGKSSEISILTDINILSEICKKRNKKTVLYGFSLGCATALYFNSLYKCEKIILENPFLSLKELVKKLPVLKYISYLTTEEWNNIKRIQKEDKVLFLLSEYDQLVDNNNGKELCKMCEGKIIMLKGADHNNGIQKTNEYFDYIIEHVFGDKN